MKKLKVVTVVGTRPEIIRLSRLIPKLDELTDHVLVHTGQNYDYQLNDVFFEELGIRRPDYFLKARTTSLGAMMADVLVGTEEVLLQELPDVAVILGDTNSSIAAIVAERLGVHVYHLEAGNRSFDWNVPEEINRRLIDHVATFNLPYSEMARRNLLAEGLSQRFVSVTGSPLPEVIQHFRSEIEDSKILENLGLQEDGYFLVSAHRQENVNDPTRLRALFESLNALAIEYGKPVVFPAHPRTVDKFSQLAINTEENLRFTEPLGFFDYQKLQLNALCTLSDSGSISEEASTLGIRAVTIRDSMERQEAMEMGVVVMCGLEKQEVLQAVATLLESSAGVSAPLDYEGRDFSTRVVRYILSTARRANEWKGLRVR